MRFITLEKEVGSRTVKVCGPVDRSDKNEPIQLNVAMMYTQDNSGTTIHKAVALDNVVIPRIIDCVNAMRNVKDPIKFMEQFNKKVES